MAEFKCQACGSDNAVYIGTTIRGFIHPENGLSNEMIPMFACAGCSVVFLSPQAWSGLQPQSGESSMSTEEAQDS